MQSFCHRSSIIYHFSYHEIWFFLITRSPFTSYKSQLSKPFPFPVFRKRGSLQRIKVLFCRISSWMAGSFKCGWLICQNDAAIDSCNQFSTSSALYCCYCCCCCYGWCVLGNLTLQTSPVIPDRLRSWWSPSDHPRSPTVTSGRPDQSYLSSPKGCHDIIGEI